MRKNLYSGTGLFLLLIAFMVFTLMNNSLFSNVRLDLTENKLFTLSDGSREIVQTIDEPVNLYFFFSETASQDLTSLRAYAVRVRELLEEYALAGGEKINLRIIDPEPFSEAEDEANGFGLQSVPVSAAGDELYFGLAGTNALDEVVVISFFQPDKEEFLEYEISKLIQGLVIAKKPVIGVLSSLPVQGEVNMSTFQNTPSWTVIRQLEQLAFLVQWLEVPRGAFAVTGPSARRARRRADPRSRASPARVRAEERIRGSIRSGRGSAAPGPRSPRGAPGRGNWGSVASRRR